MHTQRSASMDENYVELENVEKSAYEKWRNERVAMLREALKPAKAIARSI